MTGNDAVIERFQKSRPRLIGIVRADEAVRDLDELTVLHAGPPIEFANMNGPMRGAVIGGLVYEGRERKEAEHLVETGQLKLVSCNDVGFVAPLAGVVTRSMPVWFVEDETYGNRAYSNLNEGLGRVLRFGANDDKVVDHLKWMERVLGEVLQQAIERHGPLDLKEFLAEGLRRGDECHNRNKASTSSFVREFAPAIDGIAHPETTSVFEFLRDNDHFCLNLSIAASKCSADAAHAAGLGSVVTAMASNGHEFGLRVSGLEDRWIRAPAGRTEGAFFEGFSAEDAAFDMGDSYISEVVGLGGFAMAAAPAIASFVGGTPTKFAKWTEEMYRITLAEHEQFRIPALDFRGAPLGIEVERVVEQGVLPVMNSGVAHKQAGMGQVGAGLARPPMTCFRDALDALSHAGQATADVSTASLNT